jgi:hypothetical protein
MISVRHAQLVSFFRVMSKLWGNCVKNIPNLKFESKCSHGTTRMKLFLPAVLDGISNPHKLGGMLVHFRHEEEEEMAVPPAFQDLSVENQVCMLLLAVETSFRIWKRMHRKSKREDMERMKDFMKKTRSQFGKDFDSLKNPYKLEAVLLRFRI